MLLRRVFTPLLAVICLCCALFLVGQAPLVVEHAMARSDEVVTIALVDASEHFFDRYKPQAVQRYSRAVKALLLSADQALLDKAYTTPLSHNAYQLYQSVLFLDAGNKAAKKGVKKIRQAYIGLLEQAVESKDAARITSYYHRAKGVGVDSNILKTFYSGINRPHKPTQALKSKGIFKVRYGNDLLAGGVNSEHLRDLGNLYQHNKQFIQAIPIYRKLVEINFDNSNDWLGLAVSLDSEGLSLEAREAYQNVVRFRHSNKRIIRFSQQRIQQLSLNVE